MDIVQQLDEGVWRDFVDKHPLGNIFHTPEMFQVFAQTKMHQPMLWAVIDNNKRPLALLLPVYITLMNGLLRSFTTRAVVYGSVLCVPGSEGNEALRLLLQVYQQQVHVKALFTELRNLSDLSDWHTIFQEMGFDYIEYLNYLINLDRSTEEILQSIGSRTRKKIRKGLRDGLVQVTEVTQRSELAHWYEILEKTYNTAQVPLAHPSMFEAAFDVLHPKGMAKFLVAWAEGQPVACSVELPYKDTIYGWYGGCDRDYGKYLPNEMLMWHVLEWGANNGYRVYDFGGAGKPEEEYGVRDFKAKFNGDLVCFGRYNFIHSTYRFKLSELGYHLYRRLL